MPMEKVNKYRDTYELLIMSKVYKIPIAITS